MDSAQEGYRQALGEVQQHLNYQESADRASSSKFGDEAEFAQRVCDATSDLAALVGRLVAQHTENAALSLRSEEPLEDATAVFNRQFPNIDRWRETGDPRPDENLTEIFFGLGRLGIRHSVEVQTHRDHLGRRLEKLLAAVNLAAAIAAGRDYDERGLGEPKIHNSIKTLSKNYGVRANDSRAIQNRLKEQARKV